MSNLSYTAESVENLIAELDAYAYAREQVRKADEGSDDERLCIANAAAQWGRLASARDALIATGGEG